MGFFPSALDSLDFSVSLVVYFLEVKLVMYFVVRYFILSFTRESLCREKKSWNIAEFSIGMFLDMQ